MPCCCRDDPVAEKPTTKTHESLKSVTGSNDVKLHEQQRGCSCSHCPDLPIGEIARCCQDDRMARNICFEQSIGCISQYFKITNALNKVFTI